MATSLDFLIAIALGVMVAVGELVSLYRDAPRDALYSRPALLYLLINAAASGGALALVHAFNWQFGATGEAMRWTRVLVAGLGAMALFRSSLFTVRAGDKDIAVGPASFLEIFRHAAASEVDRVRAQARGQRVGELMRNLDYKRASEGLIPYCLALMQNVPDEEQKKMLTAVNLLTSDTTIDDSIKVRILGLHLMNVVGPNVLTASVESLRDLLVKAAEA